MSLDHFFGAGIVSAPLQVILDRVEKLITDEAIKIKDVDKEARKLLRTAERVRAMVRHVQENLYISRNHISNDAWKVWLVDVEVLLNSADDLLDELSLDLSKDAASLSADAGETQVRKMLLSSWEFTKPHEVQCMREELEGTAKEMDALLWTESIKLMSSHKVLKSPRSSNLVDERQVFGREKEKNHIVEMLMGEDSGSNVSIIPILGMAGIGKTTIARMVYNDERLSDTFGLKVWVCVSVDFDIIAITKSIIESVSGERCKLSDLDSIQAKLRNLIRGKRFLVVLDDYWTEKLRDWDVLSSPFRVGAEGSKVILTTRSMTVSRIVGTVPSYELESLSDESCWGLIKQRARPNKNLEQVGRELAKICKGLPLAATTLGCMLSLKDGEADWNSILKSDIWELPESGYDVLPALYLSYSQLPAHLKRCFLYCSVFPEKYEFEPDELVLIWMGQGFVAATGEQRPEDVGIDYFKELLWRSFFQFSHVNAHGQKIYKMHDLIYGLARQISGHTFQHQEINQEYTIYRNTRHLSLHCESAQPPQPILLKGFPWYKSLSTFRLICSKHVDNIQVSRDLFVKLKSLRSLDLSHLGLDVLPNYFKIMKLLRYLNLSDNRIKQLPESVRDLFGLQTLKLEKCPLLGELPVHMNNMVNLRHFQFDVKQLKFMPPEFGKLVNLQSLSAFIVGRAEGCGIGQLKNMRFLTGSICVMNLENVTNVDEAKEAMLETKPFLDRIELEWTVEGQAGKGNHHQEILAGLCPHESLRELLLRHYRGCMLPGWFGGQSKLCNIHLEGCHNYNILTPLGKLASLKSLVIEYMDGWSVVGQEFSGFPTLESLVIKNMPRLTSWEDFHGSRFPRIRTLDIGACPKLTNLPSLRSTSFLQELIILSCPEVCSLPHDGLPISLQYLRISESDNLKDRCRGEDGDKIRSIPKIEMD